MKPKIAIVNSSSFGKLFPEHLERLNGFAETRHIQIPAGLPATQLVSELIDFHGIIVSVSPKFTAEILQALKNLVVISRHGIGCDNIDIKAATRCGICVSRVPGAVEQEAVAEHTLALMLAASRQIVQARDAVARGQWNSRAKFIGVELRSKKVGLIGFGNVGRRVSEILSKGFGAEVVAFDPFLSEQIFPSHGARRVTFEELLTTCDVISLHCTLNDTNYNCLNGKEFSMMKKGVILVNTSRAELINEGALIRALESGFVGAYSADVAEGAPISSEHPLLKFSNATIVPHLGAYTLESLRGMGEAMVKDMEEVFVKRILPQNIVDRPAIGNELRKWA